MDIGNLPVFGAVDADDCPNAPLCVNDLSASRSAMFAVWMSREHFSVTDSDPIFTSTSEHRLELAIRSVVRSYRAAPVIAELSGSTWAMISFVEKSRLRPATPEQAEKYEGVRADTKKWTSTMRDRPPVSETRIITIDLDRIGEGRDHSALQ